jgi:hypothetical protein
MQAAPGSRQTTQLPLAGAGETGGTAGGVPGGEALCATMVIAFSQKPSSL